MYINKKDVILGHQTKLTKIQCFEIYIQNVSIFVKFS